LSIRTRPSGWPVMYQTWDKLLFLHWPIAAELLRPLIAPRLCLDTFEGRAWVGVTPFTMWGIRPTLLPSLPVLSQSHELNVRTYVHMEDVPGVWFFSLDASNALAVLGARLFLDSRTFRLACDFRRNITIFILLPLAYTLGRQRRDSRVLGPAVSRCLHRRPTRWISFSSSAIASIPLG